MFSISPKSSVISVYNIEPFAYLTINGGGRNETSVLHSGKRECSVCQ